MTNYFKIILMDYNGEILYEYSSSIVPTVDDTILFDDDKSFIVSARHFSTSHFKVVLLGEIDHPEPESIKDVLT